MRITAALTTLLAAGATLAAQSTPPLAAPPPAPGTLFLTPERVPLKDGTLVDAERGLLFVPVNRSDTSRGVVGVEIWRFRAQTPSSNPPIFFLPGGPGFLGFESALSQPDWYDRAKQFTAVADWVIIGQRGIGTSRPDTRCAGVPGPYNEAKACRAYWEQHGLDLRGFTVLDAARDVADVARALGYRQIVIYGVSFGSHWGMAVMRFHPEVVARAVLSGMEGPDHTYDDPSGLARVLERVAAEAERAEAVKTVLPEMGLMGALHDVRRRLARTPASVTVTDTAGRSRQMTFTALQLPGLAMGYTSGLGNHAAAATWPADILRLYYGDFETVARQRVRPSGPPAAPEYRTASFFMLDCGSGITPARLARFKADSARFLVGDRTTYYQASCPAFDADLGDGFRANFDTSIPTVIVQGTWDVSTPYENAVELAPHFKHSRFVTVEGGSHGALREALMADSAFARGLWEFVRSGSLAGIPERVALPPPAWVVPDDLRELARRAR